MSELQVRSSAKVVFWWMWYGVVILQGENAVKVVSIPLPSVSTIDECTKPCVPELCLKAWLMAVIFISMELVCGRVLGGGED